MVLAPCIASILKSIDFVNSYFVEKQNYLQMQFLKTTPVHVFLMIINSCDPVYDNNFCDTLALLEATYGKDVYTNIIPIFTRWSTKEHKKRRRKNAGIGRPVLVNNRTPKIKIPIPIKIVVLNRNRDQQSSMLIKADQIFSMQMMAALVIIDSNVILIGNDRY